MKYHRCVCVTSQALEEKEQERMDIEEKYSNLQEEVNGKTKKLKKVWTMLMQAKSEVSTSAM